MRHTCKFQLMKTNQQAPVLRGRYLFPWLAILLLIFRFAFPGVKSQVLESFFQTGGAFEGSAGIYQITAAIEPLQPGGSTATGDYVLLPGIWSIQEASSPGDPPTLQVALQDAEATIFWPLLPANHVLQRTSTLTDLTSWTDVPAPYPNDGEFEFITISVMESGTQFFRLRSP